MGDNISVNSVFDMNIFIICSYDTHTHTNMSPNSTVHNQWCFNSSPRGQNGRHFAHDIFKRIFVNEKYGILINISLKFVPKGPIDNNPALV